MDFTIGCPVSLPKYLVRNRSIVALNNYDDNLCFFRCLAVRRGARPDYCTRLARKLFFNAHQHEKANTFRGIKWEAGNNMDLYEGHFKININVWELDKNLSAKLLVVFLPL